jgi:LPXTG-motif cell wall-anchored protein
MSEGLTFDNSGVKVYLTERKYASGTAMDKSKWVQVVNGKATDLTDLIGKSYTAATAKFYTLTENVEHTDWNPKETHTFDAAFDQDFMNDIDAAIIKDGKQFSLVLLYSATLNGSAVIAGDGNTNTMNVTYGDTQKTTPAETVTYTWELDILKYTGDDKTPLDGAQFQLKNGKDTVLKFIKLADGSYRYDARVQDTEIPEKGQGDTQDTIKSKDIQDPDDATKTVTVVDTITTSSGKLSIVGLDGGDYTIAETVAPKGYNKLAADIPVHITSDAEGTAESVKYGEHNTPATAGQVVIKGNPNELASANDDNANVRIDIKNETGTELPSTGGMGTTLFYVIGSILVIGAGVLLVVRRRMNDR